MKTIRFIGEWQIDEQHALRRAIREVERFVDLHTPQGLVGKQWVCRCICESEGTVYSVHHAALPAARWDPTFFGLLKQVYRMTWEREVHRLAHPNALFIHNC